jgi:hypothetical protein
VGLREKWLYFSYTPPGQTASLRTRRWGMLKPWIVAGLGRPAARGNSPFTQISA